MTIDLGRLFGLRVIVTCGSDEKCARALSLGAAHAINYKTSDFVEEVARVTGGKGVEIVFDHDFNVLTVYGKKQRGGAAGAPSGKK